MPFLVNVLNNIFPFLPDRLFIPGINSTFIMIEILSEWINMVSYAVSSCALFEFVKLALRDGGSIGRGVNDIVGNFVGGHITNF